jgi:hypothetical protein
VSELEQHLLAIDFRVFALGYDDDHLLGIYKTVVYMEPADGISGSAPIERCPAIIIRLGNVLF